MISKEQAQERIDNHTEEANLLNTLYSYKGNTYVITGFTYFKHPDTREWVDCILYTKAGISMPNVYCRERKEFLDKFENLENHNDH